MTDGVPSGQWWTTTDVAKFLGVRVGTVSSYRQRGQMPAPDQTLGSRTHLWRPETIRRWHKTRPRLGVPAPAPTVPEGDTRWTVHGERDLYVNEWVRLSLVDVEPPGAERFEHHVVTLKAAAVVAVVDEDEENVLMLWRHRFAADVWNWELVGGVVEDGEEPAKTVMREAIEETGYRLGSVEHLVTFEPMIGMVRAPHHVYVGRDPVRIGEPTEMTEMQRMEWIPLAAVPQLIADGKICSSGSLVGVLQLLSRRG